MHQKQSTKIKGKKFVQQVLGGIFLTYFWFKVIYMDKIILSNMPVVR